MRARGSSSNTEGSGIVASFEPASGTAVNETNTAYTNYTDLDGNYLTVVNVSVKVEVDSYNPEASVQQSTADPDLELAIYNGSQYITIGTFSLPATYAGTGLNTTNYNFTLTTTDAGILSAWTTAANQDIQIRGVSMDVYNTSTIDEINYTNVWVTIVGTQWVEIGTHNETTVLNWNVTPYAPRNCVDLRTRSIDPLGSNSYSSYYNKNACMNLTGTSNSPPTHTTPILNSTLGTNLTSENLTVYNQSTNDANGDPVKNIINWKKDNSSITNLNMPFEGGSTATFTKDYSGFGNDGIVNGSTWNSTGGYDGKGTYHFDGDDYINLGEAPINFTGNASFTIATMFKADQLGAFKPIVCKGDFQYCLKPKPSTELELYELEDY